jgi:riboflavin kinase / FMN adenylyltransferase
MKIVNSIHNLGEVNNPVLTFGFFDGFHLGHQKLVENVIKHSRLLKGNSIIVTYWPHPKEIINPNQKIDLIYNKLKRIKIYELTGVDYILELNFNKELAQTNFSDFIDLVVKALHPKVIVVGKNHRFGKNRKGDYSSLLKLADNYGFEVVKVDPVYVEEEMVSSSVIRKYLKEGNQQMAERMLGRDYQQEL